MRRQNNTERVKTKEAYGIDYVRMKEGGEA